MAIFAQDTDSITKKIISELSRNSAFSAFQPGQKLRAIIDAFSAELGEAYQNFDFNVAASLISGANGFFLDSIAALYGIKRKTAETVTVSEASQTVKFYVSGGRTFGEINNGQDILVPAGTIIRTAVSAARPTRYFVRTNYTLPASSTSYFISVESQQSGESAVAGENSLINHDFVNYIDSANKSLLVTNSKPITYVQKDESDNDLKVRIINALTTNEAANQTALRIAALSVPGVSDVTIKEHVYGAGSAELVILSQSARVPAVLIELVQNKVNEIKSIGSVIVVKGPKEIGIELGAQLTFEPGIGENIKTATRTRVMQNLKFFLDSTPLGASVSQQQLLNTILNTDSRITKVGNAKNVFDYIYLYKPSLLDNESNRRKFPIQKDELIRVGSNEKLLTEFTISNPISIS